MTPVVVAILAPALAAAVGFLSGRRWSWSAVPIAVAGSGLALAASVLLGARAVLDSPLDDALRGPRVPTGTIEFGLDLRLDGLAAVVSVAVAAVAFAVQIYSSAYLKGDPRYSSYAAFVSLFTAAMLTVVFADDLLVLLVGWEVMGVCSYFLIGHHWEQEDARAGAVKAFVVTRLGDIGFLFGIFALAFAVGTFNIGGVTAAALDGGIPESTATVATLLLLCGVVGKSAQFPLHTWLPDAMAGPTPVSALIHAATMVTAGVFMVCRLSPMFEQSQTATMVVTFVGAATAFFAATVGTAQNDIKRVIAYSTCSQLGYMFFAAGVGAYGAAMFHLFTHAFFKALLFLGAGSVIHSMHHEQDMRFYGGLRKEIPVTFWVMLIGTLAITGVGILGIGFAGYHSKDAILESAYASGTTHGVIAFWLGAIAALLTSFYSWRLMFLTFWGKPRWGASEHIQHAVHGDAEHPDEEHGDSSQEDILPPEGTGGYHPHESPLNMLVPIGLLALGAVAAGFTFSHYFLESAEFWNGSISFNEHLAHSMHEVPIWVKYSATIVMLIGLAIAYNNYIRNPQDAAGFVKQFGGIHRFVKNKWYFDELYDFLFVRPSLWLGRLFWKGGDEGTIDRFGPHGAAYAVGVGNKITTRLQSGYLYSYALVMLLGLIGAATWAIWWAQK
jgi:NADH-quinone oxidoreductase subunit L